MINPYFIYVLSLLAVLGAYLLDWSTLFPEIGTSLLSFLCISIIISIIFGRSFLNRKIITFHKIEYNEGLSLITLAILFGYILEFAYHRNFPLLAILTNTNLSYEEFGIPTFHVILVTFNSFFSVYLFQILLSQQKLKISGIFLFLLTLLPSILIVNRGMLIMILMSCVFVYLIKYQSKITFKKLAILGMLAVLFFYLFGIAGNIRVNNTYQTNTSLLDNTLFLKLGGATEEFKDSSVPKEFFWTYIYMASPLANLQENIDNYELENDVTLSDSLMLGVTQMLPDFIGKRIIALYGVEKPELLQVTPEFNVATAFAEPYVILGWVGISLFTIFIFLFAFAYILFLKWLDSDYLVVGIAILNTIFVFNTFANMFSFTGLSFQLVYPLLFTFFNTKTLRLFLPNKYFKVSVE
jgi:hypothetical protein